MTRTFALTATILLSHALATSTQAQSTPYDDRGFDPTALASRTMATCQMAASGSTTRSRYRREVWSWISMGWCTRHPRSNRRLDQWSHSLHRSPGTSRSTSNRTKAKPRYQLPTGSLGWNGANGVILYSPAMRHETYGAGYARSPYGVVNYGLYVQRLAHGLLSRPPEADACGSALRDVGPNERGEQSCRSARSCSARAALVAVSHAAGLGTK